MACIFILFYYHLLNQLSADLTSGNKINIVQTFLFEGQHKTNQNITKIYGFSEDDGLYQFLSFNSNQFMYFFRTNFDFFFAFSLSSAFRPFLHPALPLSHSAEHFISSYINSVKSPSKPHIKIHFGNESSQSFFIKFPNGLNLRRLLCILSLWHKIWLKRLAFHWPCKQREERMKKKLERYHLQLHWTLIRLGCRWFCVCGAYGHTLKSIPSTHRLWFTEWASES